MTKSLTKLWLQGLKRLINGVPNAQAEYLRELTKTKRRKRAAPVRRAPERPARAARTARDSAEARESRVRPRAGAWAKGDWTRSYHSAPPLPGRLVNHLSYGLYIPPTAARKPMPLVVMLHGCKQTIDEFALGTRMNLVADANGFAVVYPEQSKHAHAHRCWHWYDDRDTAGLGEARAIVSLVDSLIEHQGVDPERVYLVGLSAGAGLASLLALHYPERFAAVALHSAPALGEAHSGMTAMDVMRRGARRDPIALVDALVDPASYPGMPAIIVHGDADHVVAPKNAEQVGLAFLRLNGLIDGEGALVDGTLNETSEGCARIHDYSIGNRPAVRLCLVAGLGHAWAGGDEAVPFHSSTGPDASTMIWAFLRDHRRRRPAAARRAAAR
ncbi:MULTISPECIES: PHB depolymerase family esterase [unclassified Trinickia]|jgi:poly(hydroxyalkanoate) depolymerase family esterase|uniref:extracellular catalytic domain type 1 short-chain-length polyhydroxyalkanoate depolymerase n=1 Tax=unclassified Trinickia TaxID=2638168 RepID=UPI0024060127|nr:MULTISPECIES: PHB depolymerase family esterase [unclassified Trinickia]MDG0027249.1 PHB depolymerase family esterase [Trinickia sp. Y13]HVW53966.1 PHB depolymerase family esterase [Trinickia sp.]